MKLTFVTPRYGLDIVGGAEYAVRVLAENCIKYGNIEAQVLTTTAGDERTWSKKYDVGTESINGVEVQRFTNNPIDRNAFDTWASALLATPTKVADKEFGKWLTDQGPYSPELLEAIENSQSDAIVFHPMLSSPAAHGIFRSKRPTILHPALHDEPLSRMPGYGEVMNKADLLAFSTRSEQSLANELYGLESKRQCVLGFGIDEPMVDEKNFAGVLSKYNLEDKNYAVVIGRVDAGKGSDLIYKMFEELKKSIKYLDCLVFVGPKSESSIVTYSISTKITGLVSDEEKWSLLANARCLISPSITESFSLVVLEAMILGIPVLVNGNCGPTLEHITRSGAGAYFVDAATFVAGLELVSKESEVRNEFVQLSKQYVNENYSWEKLIPTYTAIVSGAACSFTNL